MYEEMGSLDLTEVSSQVARLRDAGEFTGPVADLTRKQIGALYGKTANTEDRVALASLAGQLNPPGDVNRH